jgi:hypothetical protein
MVQSRRGVTQILEAQAHLLAVAIPRFIQMGLGFKGGKGTRS